MVATGNEAVVVCRILRYPRFAIFSCVPVGWSIAQHGTYISVSYHIQSSSIKKNEFYDRHLRGPHLGYHSSAWCPHPDLETAVYALLHLRPSFRRFHFHSSFCHHQPACIVFQAVFYQVVYLIYGGIYHGPQPLGGWLFIVIWLGNLLYFWNLSFSLVNYRVVYTDLLQSIPPQ